MSIGYRITHGVSRDSIVLLQHARTMDPGYVVPQDASDAPPAHKKRRIVQQAEDESDGVPATTLVPQAMKTLPKCQQKAKVCL